MSELHAKSRSRGTSLFWPAYMLSWAVLAGGALTYLSLNALPPSLQTDPLGTPPQSNQESNRAELDRAQLTAQVRSLNETVASLRTDLARFKHAKQARAADTTAATSGALTEAQPTESSLPESSSITTSSVSKSEPISMPDSVSAETAGLRETTPPAVMPKTAEVAPSSDKPVQPKIVNAPDAMQPSAATSTAVASPTAPAAQPRRRRNLATSPLRPGRVPPLPFVKTPPPSKQSSAAAIENPYKAKLLNKPISQIRTSSLPVPKKVSPPRIAAKTPTKPRPTAFGVPTVTQPQAVSAAALSLSTAQSVTGLRASWLLLTSRLPDTFNRFQPRYIADRANGTYRLLAGPISSHAEADRICTKLRAKNVSCGVTTYIGSALQ